MNKMQRRTLKPSGRRAVPKTAGPRLPGEMEISLSNRCALACTYCYFGIMPREPLRALSARQLRLGINSYIAAAGAAGVKIERISFVDSPDPLSRYSTLKDGIEHIRSRLGNEVMIEVQTNGLLLDPAKASFLIETGARIVLRMDGARRANNAHRRFRGAGTSVFDRVMRRLKALPEGHIQLIQAAPSFTRETAPYIGRSVRFLHELGFQDIQLKNLNLPEIWSGRDLQGLRRGLKELKAYCVPLINKRLRAGKGLRLHLTSLKKEDRARSCEFVLGCDGNFYPGSCTPKAPGDWDFSAGNIRVGVDAKKLLAIREGVLRYLRGHDRDGRLKYIPSVSTFYLAVKLRGLDPAEAIRSNGEKALIILEELGNLLQRSS